MIQKTLLYLLLLIFLTTCISKYQHKKLRGKPKTLQESFIYLDKMLDDTSKYTFMKFPEEIATIRLHHGFGTWIRNNWGLWGNSKLKRSLIDSGFVHPDDMSTIILKAYHRYLNNKPLRIKEEAKRYQKYWDGTHKEGLSMPDTNKIFSSQFDSLIQHFPKGDTVQIPLYATKKKGFNSYASSVNALGVVQKHIDGAGLVLKLIKIEQRKNHIVEYQKGDTIKKIPYECNIIPPKNWKYVH